MCVRACVCVRVCVCVCVCLCVQVHHPNVVTLYGGCLKPPHIFLVEERMEVSAWPAWLGAAVPDTSSTVNAV